MTVRFRVYVKFFFFLLEHSVYDISFQCDIVLVFELRESLSLVWEFLPKSAFQNPKYSAVCF